MSVGRIICPLCPQEQTSSLKFTLRDYVKHISLFHAHQPGFQLTCGIGGCKRTFHNFGTFKNHLSSYHQLEANPTNEVDDGLLEQPCDEWNGDDDYNAEGNPSLDSISTLQESSALFLLKAKEGQKLTQMALQGVIEGVTALNQARLNIMHSAINQVLMEAGISPPSVPGLKEIFDPNGEFGRPFLGLETQYQQLKFYKTHYQFVVSLVIIVSNSCGGIDYHLSHYLFIVSKSDIVLHLLGASPHCSWRASAPQGQWEEATLCPGGGHYDVCPNFADIAGSSTERGHCCRGMNYLLL